MRWTGRVVHTEEVENAYTTVVGKPVQKTTWKTQAHMSG